MDLITLRVLIVHALVDRLTDFHALAHRVRQLCHVLQAVFLGARLDNVFRARGLLCLRLRTGILLLCRLRECFCWENELVEGLFLLGFILVNSLLALF